MLKSLDTVPAAWLTVGRSKNANEKGKTMSNADTFKNLPADVLTALDNYDAKCADGTLTLDGEFRVIPGPTHPEVWMPGNALDYFVSTGGIK